VPLSLSPRFTTAEPLPRGTRSAAAALIVAAHLLAGWLLLQVEPVRAAVSSVAPVFVSWLAPPKERPKPVELPPPAPRVRKAVPTPRKPREAPVIARAPEAAPTEAPSVIAPPPPPEPIEVAATTSVVEAAPIAAAPAPSPPAPKTISIGAVSYLTPPVLHYPPAARRAQEEGRVHVRVMVDADGRPREFAITRSSGFPRLDEAALATVRATRFKPYTENGVPQPFWVVMPLVFELEN
jgi:protein TonB